MSDEMASRLLGFLDKARSKHKAPAEAPGAVFPGADPVVSELVRSFLWWEVGGASAERALASIRSHAVDLNELRVFLADEIAGMLGPEDPRGQERAERLRACLNDIFMREHDVRLAGLAEEGKRDTRAYLESLDGMHPYVVSRVVLLCLGGHAFPMDGRLRDVLVRARVVSGDQSAGEVGSWIERHVRAGEAGPAYAALEALAEQQAVKAAPARSTTRTRASTGGSKRAGGSGGGARSRKSGEASGRSKKASSEN